MELLSPYQELVKEVTFDHISDKIEGNILWGFPSGSAAKNLPAMQENRRFEFDPWLGRSPRRGHGNPLQYPSLENPTDRGAQWL